MENLSTNYSYILEMSLNDLRHQSKQWVSEVELWTIELSFFRKMIRVNYQNLTTGNQTKETEHYIELIDYYRNRLLKELKSKLKSHEARLKDLMNGEKSQDEEAFRENHKNISQIINTFESEFRNLKGEFLTFMETVLND